MSTNDTRIRVTIEDQAGDEVLVSAGGALSVTSGGSGATADQVQGAIAHDSAISTTAPVRIGARARSSSVTAVSNDDVCDLVCSTQGVIATVSDAAGADGASATNGFHIDKTGSARSLAVVPSDFNGSTWDRRRNNTDLTILASAARTATLQSSDITNYNGRGMHLVIDVTAASATPSVVFTIQGKDALSGKYYTILASSAITGTGTTVLKVCPGITAAANASVSDLLPRTWRIDATHADSDSITYSVGASVIL